VDIEPDTDANLIQNVTFRRCQTRNNYECGWSISPYASTAAPISITLDKCEAIGDRMGSYDVSSLGPNVSGSIVMRDCVARGGAGPGLLIRGKSAKGAELLVDNMQLINTATKMWIAGGEQLRFPVSIVHNGATIGTQGGIKFRNLTVIDQLETLPGGDLPTLPNDLQGNSKRAWLNATDVAGIVGVSGDATVVNANGCPQIVSVGTGVMKDVSVATRCVH
jgi:hypothetical protein